MLIHWCLPGGRSQCEFMPELGEAIKDLLPSFSFCLLSTFLLSQLSHGPSMAISCLGNLSSFTLIWMYDDDRPLSTQYFKVRKAHWKDSLKSLAAGWCAVFETRQQSSVSLHPHPCGSQKACMSQAGRRARPPLSLEKRGTKDCTSGLKHQPHNTGYRLKLCYAD